MTDNCIVPVLYYGRLLYSGILCTYGTGTIDTGIQYGSTVLYSTGNIQV